MKIVKKYKELVQYINIIQNSNPRKGKKLDFISVFQNKKLNKKNCVQSNLCTTTTQGTQNLWPLLTGGRCSEVTLCYKT